MKRDRGWGQGAALAVLLAVVALISISMGSASLSVWDSLMVLLNPSGAADVYTTIIMKVRLPRVILSGLTGAGLALAGASLQGLFRNPLADANILGISAGAALGATLATVTGVSVAHLAGIGAVGLCAFAGAVLTTLFVYGVARIGGRTSAVHIVLAGTAVGSMLSAVISVIMIFNRDQVEKVYFWTMGSFSGAGWTKVVFAAVFTACCGLGLLRYSRELDALSTGEEEAASLGVDTARVRKRIILITSMLVAACVSAGGIIGFVGLIVPHVLRMLTGAGHRKLLPFSALGGAAFLIACDTVARTAVAPSELPVGAVTALVGGPFFIFLLFRNKKRTIF